MENACMQIGSQKWKTFLIGNAQSVGIEVTPGQADQMAAHAIELLRWNQKINLTAIKDPRDTAIKHYIDSITAVSQIPENAYVLDVGSGGGFPGIPIKIMRPDVFVTLADSSRKKTNFLKNVIRRLQLQSIEAHQCRVELLCQDIEFQQYFDVIICRAFTSLKHFVRIAQPLLSVKGVMIALKGDAARSEIEAIRKCAFFDKNSLTLQLEMYTLPHIKAKRFIVKILMKTTATNIKRDIYVAREALPRR